MLKYLSSLNFHKVNSLKIRSNGSSVSNGHYSGCVRLPGGGLAFWGGRPVEIVIIKDLVGWSKEEIEKKSLKAGEALILVKDSLIARKPIDIKNRKKIIVLFLEYHIKRLIKCTNAGKGYMQ